MIEWLLRTVGALQPNERLIKIKSLTIMRDRYGILGPSLLVDQGSNRMTVRRIYEGRIARLFRERD